ncbi:hypothetical protein JCM10207_002042 [Rhodosporidiobolus poonsookiae]
MHLAAYGIFLASTAALTARACTSPSPNPCDDGSIDCVPLRGDTYTDTDGTLLTGVAQGLTLSDLTVGCYCQWTQYSWRSVGEDPLDRNVLVTRCTRSFGEWYDGTNVEVSGAGDILTDYQHMRCSDFPIKTVPDVDKPGVYVSIAWPTVDIHVEAPLPEGTTANPDGQCMGIPIDYGDGNANENPAPAFAEPKNCSVTTTVIQGHDNGNGAGYRQTRNVNDNAGYSLRDKISDVQPGIATLAWVNPVAATTTTSSGSTGRTAVPSGAARSSLNYGESGLMLLFLTAAAIATLV